MYKVYIISLINANAGIHSQSASRRYRNTIKSCQEYQWPVELFNAVNGYNLTENVWSEYHLLPPKKSTKHLDKFGNLPGAHGCFLSHFTLWNQCISLNEPIIVLEDDSEILSPLTEISTEFDLLKLTRPYALHQSSKLGTWSAGASAYWLSPIGAKKLVEFSTTQGPGHADKLMGSNILNWGYILSPIVKISPTKGSSTNPISHPY